MFYLCLSSLIIYGTFMSSHLDAWMLLALKVFPWICSFKFFLFLCLFFLNNQFPLALCTLHCLQLQALALLARCPQSSAALAAPAARAVPAVPVLSSARAKEPLGCSNQRHMWGQLRSTFRGDHVCFCCVSGEGSETSLDTVAASTSKAGHSEFQTPVLWVYQM